MPICQCLRVWRNEAISAWIQSIESEPHAKTLSIIYSYHPRSPSPHLSMFLAPFILSPTEPRLVKPNIEGKSHNPGHYKYKIIQPGQAFEVAQTLF